MRHSKIFEARLMLTAAALFVGMTLYEAAKQLIAPQISLWESHMVTIVFTTVLGTGLAYFAFRKLDRLYGEREVALQAVSETVAHDLRTALRSMSSFAALLARRPAVADDPAAVAHAERITTAATEADLLVSDLLRRATR